MVSDDVRKVILWSSSAATTVHWDFEELFKASNLLTEDSVLFQDSWEGAKPLSTFRSFDNPNRREIVRAPARSKSMLSAFFVKAKTPKMGASAVS